MLLKKIKIAGFKSFVDPTVILVPSHLVAVVGPNGCGKSNIIDAVCWVMGENSVKNLRGESRDDVIFNGSTNRKPVGQASVELIFDNQDGGLGGEYASYAEISIKRVLARDGDSQYYLNSIRCRRKDIIDIFLGTGLGPRSYSIIGQNMISRVIEAKPDEMRIYLEEAAGISKYKERRRETENRINHTKENLARLNDVRAELDTQLNTLKRQAEAAEKFTLLKQQERQVRAEWITIQWRQLDGRLVQMSLQIQQQETGLESRQAELTEIDQLLESKREDHHSVNDAFQDVQRHYYAVGNDIARVEQDIRHHRERKQQWENDLRQAEHDWQTTQDHIAEMQDQLEELTADITLLEPEMQEAQAAAKLASSELTAIENQLHEWQTTWDSFNQRHANMMQTAEVEQTRIQHLEQKITGIKQRQTKLEQDQAQIQFSQLEQDIIRLTEQISQATIACSEEESQLNIAREKLTACKTAQHDTQTELDQIRQQLQRLQGQQASLETLQQTALGQRNQPVMKWLEQHNLAKFPRLAQNVEVDKGWELAVEKVLGMTMQAVCVDELSPHLADLQDGNIHLFADQGQRSEGNHHATTLLSKVRSKYALDSILGHVYIAESLADAFQLTKNLAPHESVITRDGVWLNAAWMKISREKDSTAGVFAREQELKQLVQQIATLTETRTQLEAKLTSLRDELTVLEKQRDQVQQTLNQRRSEAAEVQAQCKIKQERLTELKRNNERLLAEIAECNSQQQSAQDALEQSRVIWQKALSELEQSVSERENLQKQRESGRETLNQARENLHQSKDLAHQCEIRLQTSQSQRASLQQNITRTINQLATLEERKKTLQTEYAAIPSADLLEESLNTLLQQRLTLEEELNEARLSVEASTQEIRLLETKRHETERELAKFRDQLEGLRVNSQGIKVKVETLLEQMQEVGTTIEEVLPTILEEATAEEWQQKLEQITNRITRLGPINLVAIEEYATCSERQSYLEKQHNDLMEGLTTLESAIDKIDRETRARFRETYDFVNTRFQELFPKIFGGGKAYLELTDENLLDAGVSIMACPPGKRNSTIHLLSGGEKAMTAIALVFSIFHLNPAPFCLLDEVDAPLDDANINRFCQLVKTMAEKTQFIFISHNKLAIEMAEHLIGVTMHEPGVSRLVSVNVEEAISLAG